MGRRSTNWESILRNIESAEETRGTLFHSLHPNRGAQAAGGEPGETLSTIDIVDRLDQIASRARLLDLAITGLAHENPDFVKTDPLGFLADSIVDDMKALSEALHPKTEAGR